MSELNQDGLIPGQAVDFETIQRIERARGVKDEQSKEDGAADQSGIPAKSPSTRKAKAQD
jgi:hypothetical protein